VTSRYEVHIEGQRGSAAELYGCRSVLKLRKSETKSTAEFAFSILRSPKILAKSAEVRKSGNAEETVAYTNRTKSAKSGGLERAGPGERISGLDRLTEVQRFVRECP
jgi:hypothetical protein